MEKKVSSLLLIHEYFDIEICRISIQKMFKFFQTTIALHFVQCAVMLGNKIRFSVELSGT